MLTVIQSPLLDHIVIYQILSFLYCCDFRLIAEFCVQTRPRFLGFLVIHAYLQLSDFKILIAMHISNPYVKDQRGFRFLFLSVSILNAIPSPSALSPKGPVYLPSLSPRQLGA